MRKVSSFRIEIYVFSDRHTSLSHPYTELKLLVALVNWVLANPTFLFAVS